MTEVIFALNAGSTSLKCSLFATTRDRETLSLLYRGGVEDLGSEPRFLVSNASGQLRADEQLPAGASHEEALNVLLGGALDPGVILYLMSEQRMALSAVTDLLYHRSGLLGVSGESSEMRDLLASASPYAAEAIDLFVYRIRRELGSLVAVLGGLDVLVLTGGIGEHAVPIRARICQDAQWLGVRLNEEANRTGGPKISAEDSAVSVWAIPTDEDMMIARRTYDVINSDQTHNAHRR